MSSAERSVISAGNDKGGGGTPRASNRFFIGVANDKGGLGKSLIAAELLERFAAAAEGWQLIEIEQRANFSQEHYEHPKNSNLVRIGLLMANEQAGPEDPPAIPSLAPFSALPQMIPAGSEASRLLLDFGSSTFQSFFVWGAKPAFGLRPFWKAGYRFLFFIPVQGSDDEAADFFNDMAPRLKGIGQVVLVKNDRAGDNFSLINPEIKVPTMRLRFEGPPLTDELQHLRQRLTFRQLSVLPSASRRAQQQAELCANHLDAEFQRIVSELKLLTPA